MPIITSSPGLPIPLSASGGSTQVSIDTSGDFTVSNTVPGNTASMSITDASGGSILIDSEGGITGGPLQAGHNGISLKDHLSVVFFAVDESDRSLFAKGPVTAGAGVGFWNHAPPGAQPAAPVTLGDVIAIIRGCGLSA